MTAARLKGHRDHGRGSIVLDRVFPGVGRIKRASGTKHLKTFELLNGMLGTLYDSGRLDLLRAIREGILTPLEVWEHFRVGQLHRTPSPETLKPLRKAAERWVKRYKGRRGQGVSDRHRYELKAKLNHLIAMGSEDATVADLPRLLGRFREECLDRGTHRLFQYAKSTAQAFARSEFGRGSALYQAVSAVESLSITKKREGNPQSPEAARAIRAQLGAAGVAWWTMCCTGMMPDELWKGKWRTEPGRLRIDGTKRAARKRVVPRLVSPARPDLTYRLFARRLSEVTEAAVEPYDGRRTFAHWLELAGIPRSRIMAYLGHRVATVTDLYLRHEVEPHLAEDAAKLRVLLGEDTGLRLVEGGAA